MGGTLTISLSPAQLKRVLQMLNEPETSVASGNNVRDSASLDLPDDAARELGLLLNDRTEQVVRFLVQHGGEAYNSDLAKELDFENPAFTSSLLGKVTGKLRRAGVQAEGRSGTNWYKTHRVNGRTLLRVRSDVLELFKRALNSMDS